MYLSIGQIIASSIVYHVVKVGRGERSHKRYTTGLVHIRSVSPGKGEIHVAREVLRLLQEDGLASSYTAIGLDPLILEAMWQLNLPVVNLGPYGKGAHQPGERVLMSYAFGELPQLVYEVIEHLARETKEM